MTEFEKNPNFGNMINIDISHDHLDNSVDEDNVLPPVDGGPRAWSFMIAAIMIEGLMWGFPLVFGVFQSYYQNSNTFIDNKYLPLVGTLSTAISYLGTPLVTFLTIKYPIYRKYMIWVGWLVCILALIISSFATLVWHLIITQGLLYGFGFLIIYYPLLIMFNEWFVQQRGLAYGILSGFAGIYGLGLPLLIDKMLNKYGYATTLRAYGLVVFILVGPTLPLIRCHHSCQITNETPNKINLTVFKKPMFFAFTCSNVFQGLVFFLPNIYLPSYASAIGLSSKQGTVLLSLLNVSQIIGQIGMGYLSDFSSPLAPMVGSTIYSSMVVLCVWTFSNNFPFLLVFCLLYGFFAGGYSVLYCRFVTTLTDNPTTGLWLYSIFEFQRGLGSLIGGSISGILVKDVSKAAKYESLISFVGIAFLISSLGGSSYWAFKSHRPKF